MNIGAMRNRIEIQKQADPAEQNNFGEQEENWIEFASVWASIQPLVGKEYYASQQIESTVSHKIVIRFKKEVNPKMRILYQERIFDINSVINLNERNVEMILMCTEVI